MKEFLKELFDDEVDGVCFLPEFETNEISIKSFTYKRKSKQEKTSIGNVYHIVLYKADEYFQIHSEDSFTAILTDPHVYADWIINCGFYGLICKKTKTSSKFVKELYLSLVS